MSEPRFVRLLGRRDVVALAFGAMIGWSWVVLTGEWIAAAGSLGAIAAFLAGGVAMAVIGLTYAELAAAMPYAGGEHVYSLRALGRTGSFVCTWAIVLGYVSVCAFEAVAFATVVTALLPALEVGPLWTVAGWTVHASWVAIGAAGALAVTVLNVLGIRIAAVVQSAVVTLVLVIGAAFIAGAGVVGEPSNLEPLLVGGTSGIAVVLVMVPFLFVGFDVIPQAAEEVDLPFRDIGVLLVFSVGLATAWYALIVLGAGLTLDAPARTKAELVTASATGAVFDEPGRLAMITAGMAGIVTSWNAFMVGASRAIYALAREAMLPAAFARLHPRFRTPYCAIALVGALSVIAPLFGRPALVWLVDAGGLGIVVAYGFVAASFLVLRRREPALARPFRVAGGSAVGWGALALAVGLGVLYLPGSPSALAWPEEWVIVIGWTVLGAALYWPRRRAASDRVAPAEPDAPAR